MRASLRTGRLLLLALCAAALLALAPPPAAEEKTRVVGRVCRDFEATRTIWEFFRQHPRP
jgi:hypothetical protein